MSETPLMCFVVLDENKKVMAHSFATNSPDEAWRFYFSNRAGWERMRDYAKSKGYTCVRATLRVTL